MQAMKLFEGKEGLLHSFLISRCYGCQFHAPMGLLQGKDLPVRATKGCLGPSAAARSLVTILTELSWLQYIQIWYQIHVDKKVILLTHNKIFNSG